MGILIGVVLLLLTIMIGLVVSNIAKSEKEHNERLARPYGRHSFESKPTKLKKET